MYGAISTFPKKWLLVRSVWAILKILKFLIHSFFHRFWDLYQWPEIWLAIIFRDWNICVAGRRILAQVMKRVVISFDSCARFSNRCIQKVGTNSGKDHNTNNDGFDDDFIWGRAKLKPGYLQDSFILTYCCCRHSSGNLGRTKTAASFFSFRITVVGTASWKRRFRL